MAENDPAEADMADDEPQAAPIDEAFDEDIDEAPTAAPIDTPLDADGADDDADDSGVAEALRAWAAGGHSVDDDGGGDDILQVQFAQLEPPPPRKIKPRYTRINNVPVEVTVELGRKEMSVRQLTELKVQDVIDLDKLAGEAFDILINKRQFAEGEIVVVTDLMAVRITRIVDRTPPEEDED